MVQLNIDIRQPSMQSSTSQEQKKAEQVAGEGRKIHSMSGIWQCHSQSPPNNATYVSVMFIIRMCRRTMYM